MRSSSTSPPPIGDGSDVVVNVAAAASRVAARLRRDDRDPRGDGATPVSLLENHSRARTETRRSSRAPRARRRVARLAGERACAVKRLIFSLLLFVDFPFIRA
jgi:hypothetical protein